MSCCWKLFVSVRGSPRNHGQSTFFLCGFRGEMNGQWKASTVPHRHEKASDYTTEIILEGPEKERGNSK
ncbi:hypothetical protein V4B17_03760 [Bartonella sp. B23]